MIDAAGQMGDNLGGKLGDRISNFSEKTSGIVDHAENKQFG